MPSLLIVHRATALHSYFCPIPRLLASASEAMLSSMAMTARAEKSATDAGILPRQCGHR
jgi:hypothetical protein